MIGGFYHLFFVESLLILHLWIPLSSAYLSISDINHIRSGRDFPIDPSQNFFSEIVDDSDWVAGSRETNSLPLIEAPVVMSNPIWNWIQKAANIYRFYTTKKEDYR